MISLPSPRSVRLSIFVSLLGWLATSGRAAPAIPTYDVKAQGAKGDGQTLDTNAINATIAAAAAAGGGTVYFSPGTYLSGSIHLKSNITLYLESGATIEAASQTVTKFDEPEPNEFGDKFHYQDFGHSHWQNSLIWGIGLHNVSIIGPGLIHGTGLDNGFNRFADNSKGDKRYRANPEGSGNKAIALRDCHNVILRDFSILHGGWFGILATGIDNLTIDNLKIDTNRDGMDIDACNNVRITHTSVNSPWDDGICLKASYGLGRLKACENVTISDCFLAGSFDEGSVIDGTFKRSDPSYKSYGTGRIKLGTESNGDFKNITIANCVFDGSRGIAIESVDGSHIEDVVISNITMRHAQNSPIFIRLGARLRGPAGTVVGSIRRITINNLVSSDADWSLGNVISGLPGHPIEDLRFSNLYFQQQGGGTKALGARVPPEEEKAYPEPGMFGDMPSYGFFFRHVQGIEMHDVTLDYAKPEARTAVVLDDVQDAFFHHVNFKRGTDAAPLFDLRNVTDFSVTASRNIPDTVEAGPVKNIQR
ncbi:MAG: glycosyl hydrolase family 28-related protein [Lacunisphaera sp.]